LSARLGGGILAAMQLPRPLIAALCVSLAASAIACNKPHHDDHAAAEPGKESFGKLSIDELESRMAAAKAGKGKLAIYDNNQHDRYVQSRITTAKWVDFKNVQASDLPADKDTTLVFYCANEH